METTLLILSVIIIILLLANLYFLFTLKTKFPGHVNGLSIDIDELQKVIEEVRDEQKGSADTLTKEVSEVKEAIAELREEVSEKDNSLDTEQLIDTLEDRGIIGSEKESK